MGILSKIKKLIWLILTIVLISLFFLPMQKSYAANTSVCNITLSGKVNGSKLEFNWNLSYVGPMSPNEKVELNYRDTTGGLWKSASMTASPHSIDKPNIEYVYQAVVYNGLQDENTCESQFIKFTPPDKISSSSTNPFPDTTAGKPPAGATGGGAAPTVGSAGSSIRNALSPDNPGTEWVITSWKVVLGLANLALVAILVFLAAVNILHIQYDTYAIKKILPILIIGVLLADFSLLIIRMLLDFSNILTLLFTKNQTPAQFAHDLIADANVAMNKQDWGAGGLGILFIWFLFSLLLMVAFFILGFLFYIRYAVIITCAIAAPLAFIAMAFPPTQGFFKQWWGWLTKFIFMKPIVFFFLWLALAIKGTGAMGSITGWMILAFLVIVAVIIPFKLGGTVMAGWSKAGQWLTGTKAGGYIRKPIDNYIQSKKDAWKERANLGAEKYLPLVASRRQKHALWMERMKAERQRVGDEAKEKLMARYGRHLGEEKAKQARAQQELVNREKLNDLIDRQRRGKERTEEELRDRVVAAQHNLTTKEWMHKIFENEKDPETGESWAMRLGRLEGQSGEMDRAIERVNADAMLRIAHEKLGTYYTQVPKAILDVDENGEVRKDPQTGEPITVDFKDILKTNMMKKKALNFLKEGSAEHTKLSEEVADDDAHARRLVKHLETLTDEKGKRLFGQEKIDQLNRFIDDPNEALMDSSRRGFWKGMQRDRIDEIARVEADSNTPDVKEADWLNGNNQGSFYFTGVSRKADGTLEREEFTDPETGEKRMRVKGDIVRWVNGDAAENDFQSMNWENALRPDVRTDVQFLRSPDTRGKGVNGIYRKRAAIEEGNEAFIFDPATGKARAIEGRNARMAGMGDMAVMDRITQNAFAEMTDRQQDFLISAIKQRIPEADQLAARTFTAQQRAYETWKSANPGKEPTDEQFTQIKQTADPNSVDLFEKDPATGRYKAENFCAEIFKNVQIDRSLEQVTSFGRHLVTKIEDAESPSEDLSGEYNAIRGVDANGYQRTTRILATGDQARAASDTGRRGRRSYRENVEATTLEKHVQESVNKVQQGKEKHRRMIETRRAQAAPAGGEPTTPAPAAPTAPAATPEAPPEGMTPEQARIWLENQEALEQAEQAIQED